MKAPSIEEVYLNLSSLFPVWVRLIEFKTRLMEAEEASDGNPRILIISPPTDPGIKCIIEANPGGENYLLCFSKSIRQRAIDYLGIETSSYIRLVVSPFFRIPFENNFFDLILANCFFDFCHESKIMEATKEISRVTVLNGKLLSVYMDLPYNFSGKLWGWLFRRFPFLSQGCHPVDITVHAKYTGFRLLKTHRIKRLGFPIRYTAFVKENFTSPSVKHISFNHP